MLQTLDPATDEPGYSSDNNTTALQGAESCELPAKKSPCAQNSIVDTGSIRGGTVNSFSVVGLVPYWLSRDVAVSNGFDMKGMFLLTV